MFSKKIIGLAIFIFLGATVSYAGVVGTPHDLSLRDWSDNTDGIMSGTTGTTAASTGDDNGEVCVYCHTPHASNESFSPIWNKNGETNSTSFEMYGTTMAGTSSTGAASGLNPPSMACMSCHDGVSGVNSVVNAPGSGLATSVSGTQFVGGTKISFAAGVAVSIGTSLTNDHPISVEYLGTGAADSPAGLYADTANFSTGTIADFLRTTNSKEYVECGTCHDPHNGQDTNTTSQVAFLRMDNTGSALCLACHDR